MKRIPRSQFGDKTMSKKHIPTHKLTFVRTISHMYLNNFGAEIYTGIDGQAYIVCDKLMSQIPYANIQFRTLYDCEKWLENIPGNAAGKLDTVLSRLIPGRVSDDFEEDE